MTQEEKHKLPTMFKITDIWKGRMERLGERKTCNAIVTNMYWTSCDKETVGYLDSREEVGRMKVSM